MEAIAILLAAAAVAHALARAFGTPAQPLLLLAGAALAATGTVPTELLTDTLVLGVAFLLFVNGVELNPRRTHAQRNAALRVGLFQFVLLGAIGLGAALALGFRGIEPVYVALALTASSTVVVIRLLQRRRQMFEPYGRLVIGVLLLQDMLVILLMPLVTRMRLGAWALVTGIAGIVLLLALAYACVRWLAPRLARLDGDDEAMLIAILALLFLFIAAADLLDLPVVAGAFLAGVALARFPLSGMARTQLASIGDFFSAIFFTALGALIGMPTGTELIRALVLVLIVIAVTPPLVTLIAERAGFSARAAIESGLLLSQMSELSLVLGLYGLTEGEISGSTFTVIALATVLSMVLTPLITRDRVVWRLMRWHPAPRDLDAHVPTAGHVLVLGSGTTGMPLLETLLAAGNEVVVVDDDPAVIARLRDADVPCLRGDAADLGVLAAARARHARIITSTIRRPEDNRRLLDYVRGVPVLVRVFDQDDAEWISAAGGTPILYSEAAADGLLRWMQKTGSAIERRATTRADADARAGTPAGETGA